MACAIENIPGLPSDKGAKLESNLVALRPPAEAKSNRENVSKEQLIAELETIEHRLTAQTDELRETTLELTSAEQRERDRLARILHDDLQQLLLAAKWNLSSLKKELGTNRQLCRELDHAIRMVERSIDMSRSLSRDLSPPALDSGLLPALACLVEHFGDAYGFRIRVRVDGKFSGIADALRDFLFHSIRELLINAAKHSNQNQAQLHLREGRSTIEVVVSDKGVGFDLKDLHRMLARGSGLLGIWTRTVRMGGQLNVETSPGCGTTFRMYIPCFPAD